LRFPYNTQAALAVWRALFFTPGADKPEPNNSNRSAQWQRGAYLVRGLGHCNACHASRNAMGATMDSISGSTEFGGGLLPMQGWYAPSLNAAAEAGVAGWSVQQVVDLLKNGVVGHDTVDASVNASVHASVLGPMAEVVYRSTQHLTDADLQAMAVFLKDLPQSAPASSEAAATDRRSSVATVDMAKGQKLYEQHCVDCHGAQGAGGRLAGLTTGPLAYPALAGNRAVTMASSTNLVRIVRSGGLPPATVGNPRPFSMPPFDLSPEDLAVVVSYIRQAWGNHAAPITAAEVQGGR
jgi:mono/diheme cytochrome c family protein